ncbi:SH3 domain-containing protein [Adhaeribacter radiodurans]|uniref:SH3 domain-containing protein n=1 Tax=Adhaeribacter radiodurans TaxID=2745197 RepID=A0A7L7L7R2_9BACT|nr:SH3 domain-containing protein [Adhaeribacter radiodurans]QMU28881.1 SH3 domain-containing protein [Adhaeribacter radiodurans]
MKKLILSLVLFLQFGLVMARDNFPLIGVKVRSENVKMYQQAGTTTPVIQTIATTDRVELICKWNNQWAQVKVNHKIGYVLFTELMFQKPEP